MSDEVIGEISSEGDTAIVTFRKSTVSNVEDISSAAGKIAAFIDANQPTKIIFDFSGVKFFSSPVLGLLLETRARISSWNGQVFVSAINPQLHRVFKITNLDQVFKFFPDTQSAVNASKSGLSGKSD